MDNMNTMDFNQKIDVSLRASLEATPVERNASDDLSTGSSSDGFWNLIVLYTGSPQTLQNEFPSSSFTFLLGNYAIVKISEDDIPSLAAFPQVIYIERPRQLFFEIVSARQASSITSHSRRGNQIERIFRARSKNLRALRALFRASAS